ncbi:hypothetical protein F4818DRAFT_436406 [Hypoxylon cercidicola]|nr:hypothetical protein F4818DRAFT_436406 [Hypoxylon cercidicola]
MPFSTIRRVFIIESFLEYFTAALDRMPNLKMFISCAMPGDRVFHYEGYPLQADLYIVNENSQIIGGNKGFFRFMIPILIQQPRIKSLYWADERPDSSLFNLNPEAPHAFSALTSIDLCISHFEKGDLDTVVHFLSKAEELRNLSLCFERTSPKSGRELVEDVLLWYQWPHLTSLQLGGIQLPSSMLGRFCRRHSRRLRHLTFFMCKVTVPDLVQLRGTPNLELASITIRSDNDESTLFLPQERILPFVNMASSVIIGADGEPIPHNSRYEIRTEASIYDHRTCSTAAYFDSKLNKFKHAYYNTDLKEIKSDGEGSPDEGDEGEFKDSQEKTYWTWRKLEPFSDETYYWQVDNAELAKAETTFWEFTNRNGLKAYGEDPLEYFSDWDSDAGDVATPTPYCLELQEYSCTFSGIRRESPPPEGAHRYNRHFNPWLTTNSN